MDFVWDHIQPQADCMRAADGGWAVDFIGRTEHIDEDLAAVLAELEKRRPTDAPLVSRPCVVPLRDFMGVSSASARPPACCDAPVKV